METMTEILNAMNDRKSLPKCLLFGSYYIKTQKFLQVLYVKTLHFHKFCTLRTDLKLILKNFKIACQPIT